jgi:subtilisin family serine protease
MPDHVTGKRPDEPTWRPDEIVVSAGHVPPVLAAFEQAGVSASVSATDPDLGLSLLELSAAEAARAFPPRQPPAPDETLDPLSQLLRGLRDWFADRHAGWSPTMGKNRLVADVARRGGVISHGGGPNPTAVRRVLPARATGPGAGVRVGVLDTGLVPNAWLGGAISVRQSDVVRAAPPWPALTGHGSFVAGLVLQQAPGATVELRGVFDESGVAAGWDVATAIVAMGRAGVDVLNLSLVCFTDDGQPPLLLAAAIDRLPRDVVVVAAAGNHGDARAIGVDPDDRLVRAPTWPAALDDVLAVGACTSDGTPAPFTPDAPVWVDVLAPGTDVVSTFLDGPVLLEEGDHRHVRRFRGTAAWSGSSFAAAAVSGAVAAGIVPGRVDARDSLADLMRVTRPGPTADSPPWLPLTVPVRHT